MKRLLITCAAVAALAIVPSCRHLAKAAPIPAVWVKADRATYNVISPMLTEYVEQDASLATDQKEVRIELLRSWRIRLEKSEASIAATEEEK